MRTVVITGASSGIGRALALRYAKDARLLGLLGRDEERLTDVADACRALGATVRTGAIDVRARRAMAAWLVAFDRESPIDLLVANAGLMEGRRPRTEVESAEASHVLMEVNVLGVLNTVQPLLPAMSARRHGQIAIMSSIAAFTPLPDAPSYSASKAAVLNYGLSLRDALAPSGVRVSVVCPGHVDTPMLSQESGTKPFTLSAEQSAEIIVRRLSSNTAVIVFPFWFGLMTRVNGRLPPWLRRVVSRPFRFTVSDR